MKDVYKELMDTFFNFHKLKYSAVIPKLSHGDACLFMNLKNYKMMHPEEMGMKISDLAKKMHVSSPSMSRTIKHLQEKGWIERRMDEKDRRNIYVFLTPEGEEVLRNGELAMTSFQEAVLNRMGEEKVKVMVDLLQEMYEICGDEIGKRETDKSKE